MSLEDQINALAAEIASEVKELRTLLEGVVRQPVKGTDYPTYALTPEDAGALLIAGSSAGTTTVTIPNETFAEGDRVDLLALGGEVTFVGEAGLFLDPPLPITVAAKSAVTIFFLSEVQAVVIGGLR